MHDSLTVFLTHRFINFHIRDCFSTIAECLHGNLIGNGICDGVANVPECRWDGGDCCIKEACKIKKLTKCTDGEDCKMEYREKIETCKDSSCECLDPSVRKCPY